METEHSSREHILSRIRAGLRVVPYVTPPVEADRVVFEPVNTPLERFQQECVANLMECTLTADSVSSAKQLASVLQSLPAAGIFVQDHPVLRQLIRLAAPGQAIQWSSNGGPEESSQATITLAEVLIAQTGSILVTASCGGRGASIVAPCHIVFATTDQLVPDLATALRLVSERQLLNTCSFACVISGSSRTADIEKILVQGAHGPRRLVVILQSGSA
jgi:L-lactate dehydrogenase complex protein LldG